MRRLLIRILRGGALALIGLVLLIALAAVSLETPAAKRLVLRLALSQAGRILTVPLQIGELRGSIYRGLDLRNVRLVRDGEALVDIERVELDYTIAELVSGGTKLRSIRLTRPQIVGARQADGSWNLAGLLRRSAPTGRRPARSITIDSLEIVNGLVVLKDPLILSGMHVPGRYERLNTSLRIQTGPGRWSVDVKNASWLGGPSDLAVDRLTGRIESDPTALTFTDLRVQTAQSVVRIDGRVIRGGGRPAILDLRASADRFVFQEWGVVVPALSKIPIDAKFDAALSGPLAQLAVNLDLQSNGGAARGPVVLNTTIPGWHGSGTLDLTRLDLQPWFNNPAQKSDISGRATFDMALKLGRGAPEGTYMFAGSHAAYKGYAGNEVNARGDVTSSSWRIAQGSAKAYGASVTMSGGTIGLKTPYEYRFKGHASNVDLRQLPETIPVPHVESNIGVAFDVDGAFAATSIGGSGVFDESEFIGARIEAGATGEFSAPLKHYKGAGFVSNVDVNRWGQELDVAWMREPRYAGTLTGDFHAEWYGLGPQLLAGGRLVRANLFGGTLSDADVEVELNTMWLSGNYKGAIAGIDPSRAFEDARYAGSLTGTGQASVTIPNFLDDGPIEKYDVLGTAELTGSRLGDLEVNSASIEGAVIVDPERGGMISISRGKGEGPRFAMDVSGIVPLGGADPVDVTYDIARVDLTLIQEYLDADVGILSGTLATKGEMRGPRAEVRAAGEATVTSLALSSATVSTLSGKYDATFPWDDPAKLVAHVDASASSIAAFGRAFETMTGTGTYEQGRIASTLTLLQNMEPQATVESTVVLHDDNRAVDVEALALSAQGQNWRMVPATPSPVVSWDESGVTIAPARFVDAMTGEQNLAVSGNWRTDGKGALRVAGRQLSLDTLTASDGGPAPYGGLIDVDATLTGTIDQPLVEAELTVTQGRVRRLTYERLAGKVNYRADAIQLDMRLDQAPGVWLTVAGTLPPSAATGTRDALPIDLTVVSSDIGLGLLEGLTSAVRNVNGRARGNLRITGSSQTPVIVGEVDIADAAFQVAASGAQYRNGRARLDLTPERITVAEFHLEDRNRRSLEVTGSLGTSELRVGDVNVRIRARGFEVLRNVLGTVQVDADLTTLGTFDAPRLFGDVTIAGGELRVDEVLARALFQPYATTAIAPEDTDVISILNPWDRLSLNVAVHSQNALRMTGDNVAAQNAPLGLGSFNLRATGDVFLYKDPGQELNVTGSLDSISGSYAFQGRQFELYPSSSVDFRGDLNPGLFISVNRIIAGVEARVTIAGTLNEPELRLSSVPPLDPSDILSLIVFNASTNELSASQQRELAVRAGTLAVGFLTGGLTTALGRSIGLDVLEIEPVTDPASGGGARVTVGQEIAPRLVVRFSRQFGAEEYDEAIMEYLLSRVLRIRASFSDASNLASRSPFRRVEPAGIDLLFYFSF